jgi:hypothetical protein
VKAISTLRPLPNASAHWHGTPAETIEKDDRFIVIAEVTKDKRHEE